MSLKDSRFAVVSQLLLLALFISFVGCDKSEKPSLKAFASPDDAATALIAAGKSGDPNALIEIFGPDSRDIISSGDAVQDKTGVDAFVTAYGAMHRWRKTSDNTQVLLVGPDNFAFPIPLEKNSGGRWIFDAAAGRNEILARRIGRNELAVIDTCQALADAQAEYFSEARDGGSTQQFAQKLTSDAGKHNGLYWESPEGEPRSPLGPEVALATAEGYNAKSNTRAPFHGYLFRLLTQQGSHAPGGARDYMVDGKLVGGFAFVAYPAEYGNSGIMTFIINQDGILLQKDLGKTTSEIATGMTQFDPDPSWQGEQTAASSDAN